MIGLLSTPKKINRDQNSLTKKMMLDRSLLDSRFVANALRFSVFLFLIIWGFWVLTGTGLVDRSGIQIGGDFSHYWVAASMARTGEASAVYDVSRFKAAQETAFNVKSTLFWFYPPTFLMMMTPFSLLPYLAALVIWLAITLGGFALVLRHLTPQPRMMWLFLVFPGCLQNFAFGQNGFLSGALLGGGLLLMDSFPMVAGVLLGLLTYKPHLAALIPLALIAGRRWRVLMAMLTTAAALILASLIVLGSEIWLVFLKNVFFSLRVLGAGTTSAGPTLPLDKMPTVFAAVLLAGGNLPAATIFQGSIMLLVSLLVAWVWRREASLPLRSSVLVLGIFLFTPYDFVYDLAFLTLPLAWLSWEGYTRGWLPGEKIFLVLGFFSPLAAPGLAQATHVQTAPLILAALMCLALRRAGHEFSSPGSAQKMAGPGLQSQPG